MIQEFIPLNKKILVKPDETQEVSKGGIYIPTNAQDKPVTGTIIALDDGCDSPDLEVGQTVMYGKYAGNSIQLEEEKEEKVNYVVLNEKDILGIIKIRS